MERNDVIVKLFGVFLKLKIQHKVKALKKKIKKISKQSGIPVEDVKNLLRDTIEIAIKEFFAGE
jgi:hypothetical protein